MGQWHMLKDMLRLDDTLKEKEAKDAYVNLPHVNFSLLGRASMSGKR